MGDQQRTQSDDERRRPTEREDRKKEREPDRGGYPSAYRVPGRAAGIDLDAALWADLRTHVEGGPRDSGTPVVMEGGTRRAVRPDIRDAIVDRQFDEARVPDPSTRKDGRLCGLAVHLYAPTWIDPETGRPSLSAGALARLEGKLPQLASRNYVARDFVLEYRNRVDPSLEWARYDMRRGPRCASRFDHDPELLLSARAPVTETDGLVYADTGEAITGESRAQDLAALRTRVGGAGVVDHAVDALLGYLNGLPSNRFSSCVARHHGEAADLAREMLDDGRLTPHAYQAAAATMSAMVAQPVPVYAPSQRMRTTRVFAANAGLASLKGVLSDVYRRGWATYDLVSSQAAINAVDWEAHRLRSFLEENSGVDGALWSELAKQVGFDPDSAGDHEWRTVKGALKRAMYSAQFGKSAMNLRLHLDRDLRGVCDGAGDAFLASPLVTELLEVRNRRAACVEREGGLEGAFGEWIQLEPQQRGRRRNAASLLAERAQGIEMKLLLPVVDLAIASGDRWHIVLWQHDGFDVAFRDRSRAAGIDRQIRAAVDAECERQGYPTRLVGDLKGLQRRSRRQRPADRNPARHLSSNDFSNQPERDP